ncbi:MAG: glucosyl-3-phosphoglycerate synthase [Candidatus Dormibacteraeota bacterium]|nr:glucosyl-3-phosphoglycerate synthase [Candidatus Dormibacteraeota bacterium]
MNQAAPSPQRSGRRLLVPISRARHVDQLLRVANAIARAEHGGGQLLGVVEMHAERPIAQNVTVARRYRELLRRTTELGERVQTTLTVQVRVAYTIAQGIREAAVENGSDLVVLEWPGPESQRAQDPDLIDLVSDPPTDLVMVHPHLEAAGRAGVLVPVRGGPSAALALRVACAVAEAAETEVTALHVYGPDEVGDRRRREEQRFRRLLRAVDPGRLRVLELEAESPSEAISRAAAEHSVVVLGAYGDTRTPTLVGPPLEETVRNLSSTVILAKSRRPRIETPPPESLATAPQPRVHADVQAVVDRWFAENTFHAREFHDVKRLVRLKQQQGLTISVGLPTLNEEATIGEVVSTLKGALMDECPLVDEIVVVDSGSEDRTVEIAREQGVQVVEHMTVLPEMGAFTGKGEALWKSLHLMRGDIVAWCDTDISNIHPQFIYGIVGPLLIDRRLGYVKGFYRRPLNFGGEVQTAGGGRVTELMARPVLNLFYPELSGLLQPLSGEYAGRRELLERLPFFTGYGVEIGHLIDILDNFGLNCIGQSDLGVRIHRNQDLFDLSKMSFAIIQVALKRLGDRHRVHLLEEVNRSMKLIHYSADRFFLELKEIEDWERPPLITLPEYLVVHQKEGASTPA